MGFGVGVGCVLGNVGGVGWIGLFGWLVDCVGVGCYCICVWVVC